MTNTSTHSTSYISTPTQRESSYTHTTSYDIYGDSRRVFINKRAGMHRWERELCATSLHVPDEKRPLRDSVVVIPVVDNHVVLMHDLHPHKDEFILTLVGGLTQHHKDTLSHTARRRLEKETGHVYKDFYLIDAQFPIPGVNWGRYVFIARGYSKPRRKLGKFKRLLTFFKKKTLKKEVFKVSLSHFVELIKRGDMHCPLTFAEKLLLNGDEKKLISILKRPHKHVIELF